MHLRYNITMYNILNAIKTLASEKKYPVTARIAPLVGRTTALVGTLLLFYYDQGYVSRHPIRVRPTWKGGIKQRRKVERCSFYYTTTKKGQQKLEELEVEYGQKNFSNACAAAAACSTGGDTAAAQPE